MKIIKSLTILLFLLLITSCAGSFKSGNNCYAIIESMDREACFNREKEFKDNLRERKESEKIEEREKIKLNFDRKNNEKVKEDEESI